MSNLSVGDVVQLKSGGPKMTIMIVFGNPETPKPMEIVAKQQGYQAGDVSCIWFDGTEKKTGLFHAATLAAA